MELERSRAEIEYALKPLQIKLGAPLAYPDNQDLPDYLKFKIGVPRKPHVFYAKELILKEDEKQILRVGEVVVMLAHAIVSEDSPDGWQFLDTGKSVEETVIGYEKAQRMFSLPPLDVILACRNRTHINKDSNVRLLFSFRDRRYIFPSDGDVFLANSNRSDDNINLLIPGEGVNVIEANAGRWDGITYWTSQQWTDYNNNEGKKQIPQWALMSAK